jgi:hypothetical protein
MSQTRQIPISALNLNAAPHPDGIYVKSLLRASSFLIRARGSDFAKITAPKMLEIGGESTSDVFVGRILLFTQIDLTAPWLDLSSEDELSSDLKKRIEIPDNAKPNFRTFNYFFNPRNHRLYFETKNELNQTFGPKTARFVFSSMLSLERLGRGYSEINVSIVPDESALARVLKIPHLKRLTIRVVVPNGDTTSPEAYKRVMGRLEAMNAVQEELVLIRREQSDTLNPSPEVLDMAEVASENGYVEAVGRTNSGKPIKASTNDRPKSFYVSQRKGQSFFEAIHAALNTLL